MTIHKFLFSCAIFISLLVTACGDQPESTSVNKPKNPTETKVKPSQEAAAASPKINDRGAKLYKRCQTCHTLNEGGKAKTGPNLYGIFGAKAGINPDFKRYSKVMKESGIIWTDENLAGYIKNPRKFMPGNSMSFVGLKKDEDVALIIEYMREKTTE